MISKIAKNHHRQPGFFKAIGKILNLFKNQIKQTFSNVEIFNIFKDNKLIILFMLVTKLITLDHSIFDLIIKHDQTKPYSYFFFPEIKKFLDKSVIQYIEKQINFINIEQFNQKRKIGENDSYICTLIRNDSIEEFISYVTTSSLSLKNTKIKPSIFETNSFLIDKEPTLIEYASFFGSIQIFQYLKMNNVQLTSSLWLYAIHSNNADLIHILEDNHVQPPDGTYDACFHEAIKCHHNNAANYIRSNLMNSVDENACMRFAARYYNYEFYSTDFDDETALYYLWRNDGYKLVDVYMNMKLNENALFQMTFSIDERKIIRVAIPPTVTKIDDFAFYGCKKLKYVFISSSVTIIGDRSFYECSSLQEITLPPALASIGNEAFKYCQSLKNMEIPSTVGFIGKEAFVGTNIYIKLSLPLFKIRINHRPFDGVKAIQLLNGSSLIPKVAFKECRSLTQIAIPPSVTRIQRAAFKKCSMLETVHIPSSVLVIEKSAFELCISLKKVTFEEPSTLYKIDKFAFRGCSSLIEINLPKSVEKIGKDAFDFCHSLPK